MLRFGCKTASSQFAYIFLRMEFGDKFKIKLPVAC